MFLRHIEKKFIQCTKASPAVLLRGARQTGKTTFVQAFVEKFKYQTFDDIFIRSAAEKNPVHFIQ